MHVTAGIIGMEPVVIVVLIFVQTVLGLQLENVFVLTIIIKQATDAAVIQDFIILATLVWLVIALA